MYVVLDSNIFIEDLWLEGQEIRVLLNYVRRRKTKILVVETVMAEVRAHARRVFQTHADKIAAELAKATRGTVRLAGVPEFSKDTAVETTLVEWERNFNKVFLSDMQMIPHQNSVLPEVVRRATERIPPCKSSGDGVRDAVIWLTLLHYVSTHARQSPFAFVSSNTGDFAEADKVTLKKELQADCAGRPDLRFFAGLGEFNKAHANKILHIDATWLESRGIKQGIEQALSAYFGVFGLENNFAIVNKDYEDIFGPSELEEIQDLQLEIDNDISVWDGEEDGELELRVPFSADIVIDAMCEKFMLPSAFYNRHYNDDLDIDFPSAKTLTCFAQIFGDVSATLKRDVLKVNEVEDVSRR